ncbi:hypothetical protein V5799_014055 [Amblyomma americanum]|uniref:Metalloprotease TIKI homolog n=1 Tax=Amblyomma americanum TaxID=6943 RepID=A0AAQ4E453_AMBAM
MPVCGHGLLLCASVVCCCCLLLPPTAQGPQSSGVPASKHRNQASCDTSGGIRSFLWSTRSEPPSYFFGTIHVPYTRVWDHVPENAKRAFGNADSVVFELDLLDPGALGALANCQLLPEGRSLADVLPPELLARLRRHLEYVRAKMSSWMTADQRGRGLYADYLFHAITGDWERKRPIWVLLMVDSLTEGDVRARGVPVLDLFLAQEAQRLAKRTGAVEQVHEQCLPLNGLNCSQVLFALDQTLRQHERIRRGAQRSGYGADELIRHYNCGDLDAVVFSRDTAQVPPLANTSLRLSARELRLARDIDRYFRHELIYKRNHRMGDRVLRLLRANPGQSFFFAFGAGHFLGNNTVLDFVRQGGFDIEHSTESFESHLRDVKQVFSLISEAGLKLKPAKCQFLKPQVKYLGHVVSATGVRPDPEKLECVCKVISNGGKRIFDKQSKVPYVIDKKNWISYDDVSSVELKARWILSEGFGGIMTFSLNCDDHTGATSPEGVRFPLHKKIKEVVEQGFNA